MTETVKGGGVMIIRDEEFTSVISKLSEASEKRRGCFF